MFASEAITRLHIDNFGNTGYISVYDKVSGRYDQQRLVHTDISLSTWEALALRVFQFIFADIENPYSELHIVRHLGLTHIHNHVEKWCQMEMWVKKSKRNSQQRLNPAEIQSWAIHSSAVQQEAPAVPAIAAPDVPEVSNRAKAKAARIGKVLGMMAERAPVAVASTVVFSRGANADSFQLDVNNLDVSVITFVQDYNSIPIWIWFACALQIVICFLAAWKARDLFRALVARVGFPSGSGHGMNRTPSGDICVGPLVLK